MSLPKFLEKIVEELKSVEGLDNIILLSIEDKEAIKSLEEERNLGVLECLNRIYTIILTHDSNFRNPASEIVKVENGKLLFPGVAFPEAKARDVVSGSPGWKVHDFLVKRFNLKVKDEATLLVGFNS